MSPQTWAEEQASTIAAEVRRLRGSRSAQWLADQTTRLGHTITRSVIADLENGRRRYVTTAELMVLAAALNTTPVALLYPDPCAADVEMLPGYTTDGPSALQWFSGLLDAPPKVIAFWQESKTEEGTVRAPTGFADAGDPAEYDRNLSRVRIAREIWELEARKFVLAQQDMGNTDEERRAYFDAIADFQRRIDALMERYGR